MAVQEDRVDGRRGLNGCRRTHNRVRMIDPCRSRHDRQVGPHLGANCMVMRGRTGGRVVLALNRDLVGEIAEVDHGHRHAQDDQERREPGREGLPDHVVSLLHG